MQITCNTFRAYDHVQHAVCHLVRRDSSATNVDKVETAFILALSLLAESIIPMKKGRKPECPEKKKLNDECQEMPHTKARKFTPEARLKPTLTLVTG